LKIIIAFSTENESEGSPSIFQALILTGSPRIVYKENTSLEGMFLSLHDVTHSSEICFLYAAVNAPR